MRFERIEIEVNPDAVDKPYVKVRGIAHDDGYPNTAGLEQTMWAEQVTVDDRRPDELR